MTWSYSGDPSASELDEVRFLIGDTATADQQLSDEEIAYLLAEHGSPLPAAIAACDSLYALYARYADQKTGDISVSYSKRAAQYRDLRDLLRRRLTVGAMPYAGGIRKSDREIDQLDTDTVHPATEVGGMDYDGPREDANTRPWEQR